ncbi:Sec-independent protein translocase TatD [Salinisphaera sp. T5B8]|uniref:TatD family hydrolase n=1 Tax=Salinisphaera sp. T5B8 TaxID=1304154 RepID=UPI0033410E7B
MELTDIGANLAHESFADDLDDVLARAEAAGVRRLVVTGSDLDSSEAAVDLAGRYPGQCFATAGLHPHHARDWSPAHEQLMRDSARAQRLVAIGETGLDFFRDIAPRDAQERVFAAQLAVACDHGLPVFLHQRDAHARFLPILREHLPHLTRAVVHCFTDSAQALDAYLDAGCYIGVTGWICDERRGRDLYDNVARIPDDRLMIETDCPYLMPRTIRPKPKTRRNEPANLPWVAETVAAARDQSVAQVAALTHANAGRFFAIEGSDAQGQ